MTPEGGIDKWTPETDKEWVAVNCYDGIPCQVRSDECVLGGCMRKPLRCPHFSLRSPAACLRPHDENGYHRD